MSLERRELTRRLVLRLKGVDSGCGKALIGPATVQLHLTNQCNLSCRYCYYHAPDSNQRPIKKEHLPFEMFLRITRDCVNLQVDKILLSGQGEPTLHPRFYEMLDYLRLQPLSVTIFSNGTFPKQHCQRILQGANRIVINLGESDRASYRTLQGKDLFAQVIKNIKELAKLKPHINPDFQIEVVFIVNKLNAESQLKTEILVKKLGADIIRKKESETGEHNDDIRLPSHVEKTALVDEWPPCYHGWIYSAIKLNGNVNVCCTMQRLTLGNVFKTSFKEIWESEKYTHARISALKGEPLRTYKECINCCMAWHNKKFAEQVKIYQRSRKKHV